MDIQNELKSPILYDGSTRVFNMKLLESDYTFGLEAAFKEHYAHYYTGEAGVIHVGAAVVNTTPEVMAALKAILSAGCCRIPSRAEACRAVFLRICSSGTYIDETSAEIRVLKFVEDADNPFVTVLQDAIRGVLHGE